MSLDDLHNILCKLNSLLDDYHRFNNIKYLKKDFSNNLSFNEATYNNLKSEYDIDSIDKIIEICFISDTCYLEDKIKDAIFFTKELIGIDINAAIDYDRYTRLKYLYEGELQKILKTINVYDDRTKEEIKENIIANINNNKCNCKLFSFIEELLEAFREYHSEIVIANSIKRVSPNDPNFNSLKKAMKITMEYADITLDSEYKKITEHRYNNIKDLIVTRANNKILISFDLKLTRLIMSYFSTNIITDVIKTEEDDRGNILKSTIKTKFINPPKFKKEKKTSKKLSNDIKDNLITHLKDIEITYLFI